MIEWKEIVEILISVRRLRTHLEKVDNTLKVTTYYPDCSEDLAGCEHELDEIVNVIDKLSLRLR